MPAAKRQDQLHLKVVVEPSDEAPSYFVNYAETAHSIHEFSVYFAKLPTKLSKAAIEEAKETGELEVEPLLSVTLPPTVIPGLIKALQSQLSAYEAEFGEVAKQVDAK